MSVSMPMPLAWRRGFTIRHSIGAIGGTASGGTRLKLLWHVLVKYGAQQ